MISKSRSLVLAGFLTLVMAGPTVWAASGKPIRPYFGIETGTNVLQDFSFPFLTIAIEADGVASQIGRYRGEGSVVIDVTTGQAVLGEYVSTARNGDQLFAELSSTPLDEFTLLVEGTIAGGTGRFANAEGKYLFLLQYEFPSDVLPNNYDGIFSGWIRR